ncbi:4'-phosphopantetheinyl transferase superfamily protein [Rhizobium laguerreae]|uniref:4'-phosphopantetheinyl transferase family protein n=1 Tax=Rhizobium laguerreae TaxID=1076926 RepID=UPI001C91D6ED|nr:4'-phosphopantetheinyl transferase superfamily protein [Rhizobium laguerreae]MBY3301076.1 4'-phosphopantetheinyl transferase superfamily protein [Rhizobium laguerreae]
MKLPTQLNGASSMRRAEFTAGRYCALNVLSNLRSDSDEVRIGPHGEPVWPDGVVGSITHSGDLAIAAATLVTLHRGLGVDFEHVIKSEAIAEIESIVLTPNEINFCRKCIDFSYTVTLLFSCKESVSKAIFKYVGRYMDFKEIELAAMYNEFALFRPLGPLIVDFQGAVFKVYHRNASGGAMTVCLLDSDT